MPTDFKKFWTILPTSCNEVYVISPALELGLTDKSMVNNQKIGSAWVNAALQKLTKITPFYSSIILMMERFQ